MLAYRRFEWFEGARLIGLSLVGVATLIFAAVQPDSAGYAGVYFVMAIGGIRLSRDAAIVVCGGTVGGLVLIQLIEHENPGGDRRPAVQRAPVVLDHAADPPARDRRNRELRGVARRARAVGGARRARPRRARAARRARALAVRARAAARRHAAAGPRPRRRPRGDRRPGARAPPRGQRADRGARRRSARCAATTCPRWRTSPARSRTRPSPSPARRASRPRRRASRSTARPRRR